MSSMRLPSGSATNAIRTPGSGEARGGIWSRALLTGKIWIPNA